MILLISIIVLGIRSTYCPNSLMKITDVKKCRSGNFRVIVMMNKVMEDFLKSQQIKVLNTICQLYPIIFRNRCSNCHLPGHFKSQCTSPVICSFCGGNHHSSDCNSSDPKCISCTRANYDKTNHPVYSDLCPFNK